MHIFSHRFVRRLRHHHVAMACALSLARRLHIGCRSYASEPGYLNRQPPDSGKRVGGGCRGGGCSGRRPPLYPALPRRWNCISPISLREDVLKFLTASQRAHPISLCEPMLARIWHGAHKSNFLCCAVCAAYAPRTYGISYVETGLTEVSSLDELSLVANCNFLNPHLPATSCCFPRPAGCYHLNAVFIA